MKISFFLKNFSEIRSTRRRKTFLHARMFFATTQKKDAGLVQIVRYVFEREICNPLRLLQMFAICLLPTKYRKSFMDLIESSFVVVGRKTKERKNVVVSNYNLRQTDSRKKAGRYPHIIDKCNRELKGKKTPWLLRQFVKGKIWSRLEPKRVWKFVFPILYNIDPKRALSISARLKRFLC